MSFALKKYEPAIEDYTQALSINPKLTAAYINRGNIYDIQKDYKGAVKDYTQAILLNPEYSGVYNSRGNVYQKLEDYQQAIKDYNKAIKLKSDYALAHNNLCWLGSLLNQAETVMANCEQAVILTLNDGHYRDSRGLARTLTGDFKGAIEDFNAFVEWLEQNSLYEVYGPKREFWITELEAGRNPFDEATLQELLNE